MVDKRSNQTIYIPAKKIAHFLDLVSLILVLVSLTGQYLRFCTVYDKAFGLIPLVDVDRELTIPTMFSVMLLFLIALTLFMIARIKKRQKDKFTWSWFTLAFGFLFMSFDEGSSIHELTVMPIRRAVGEKLPGFLTFAWVIPGIAIILVVGIIFIRFYFALPSRTKHLVFISAAVYLSGLVGVEMIGGNYASVYGIKNLTYNLIVTVEESLEMAGMVLFFYTLLDYLQDFSDTVTLRFLEDNQKTN
ncbi:MAG: hypothetical protein J7L66_01770 [Anaerolineaceae bacterium]|nr:hypothetical protein [Anaerolineaceae bacterium]